MKCAIFLFFLSSCTHSIHLVHAGDFSPHTKVKGQLIESKSEQFVFLGMVGNTDYVNQAHAELEKKCRDGRVVGVSTQYSTSHGFLSWHNKILMRGTCIKS